MKKLLSILVIVLSFSLNGQVTGITLPKLNNGSIQIDTTGKNLKSWILYRLENHTAGKMVSYNELLMDSLEVGNYWLLATSSIPNYPFNYCYEGQYSIGVLPPNPCPTSDNIVLTEYQDNNMLYFCGSYNNWPPPSSMQWYLDSLPINSGYYGVDNFCKNAVIASDNVYTLVSYGSTCNEYKTITQAFTTSNGSLNYPYVTVFAGSGSFTNSSTSSIVENTEDINTILNPFKDVLEIDNINGSLITIYDMMGNTIYQSKDKNISLNTSKIVEGNYILEVNNYKTINRKIILKKN